MVPIESLGAVSYSPSDTNYGSILHPFRDKARYWSQIVIFHTPFHSAPPLGGGSPLEYCHSVRCGKTRMVGLPDGRKSFRICVTGYTQYRRVTDGRTDRRTDILPRHSPRYAYASRGKNDTGTVNLVPCHIVGCCQIEFNNIFPVLSRIILLTDTARSHTAINEHTNLQTQATENKTRAR